MNIVNKRGADINYFLTEEQQMIKELAARIADEKIAPVAIEYDGREVSHDIMKHIAQSDLCGVYIEENMEARGGVSRCPSWLRS